MRSRAVGYSKVGQDLGLFLILVVVLAIVHLLVVDTREFLGPNADIGNHY